MKSNCQYKISIILPVYNVENYIEACFNSIISQTVTQGIECVIVDDCGKDHSIEIVEKLVASYEGDIHFKIVHHVSNKGLSAARNTGIKESKGEYVYFLDSDDTIIPECMEGFLCIIAEHPNVDLLQGLIDQDSVYMNQFAVKDLPDFTEDRKYIKRALLDFDELPVCAANKMVRRELIIDNNLYFKEGIIHEDNHWSFFLAKYVSSLAVYKKKCYLYTVNPQSITKDIDIAKETHSAKIIIEDYCNNIDSFMQGEQKIAIFNFLRLFIDNYKGAQERKFLINTFMNVCNYRERFLFRIWQNVTGSSKFRYFLLRIIIANFRTTNK